MGNARCGVVRYPASARYFINYSLTNYMYSKTEYRKHKEAEKAEQIAWAIAAVAFIAGVAMLSTLWYVATVLNSVLN